MRDVPPARPQPSDPIAQAALACAAAAAAVLFLPAVAAAVAAGELLRRRGLRWTWALAAALATAPLLVALAPQATDRLVATVADAVRGHAHPLDVAVAATLLWLLSAPAATLAYMLWRDRRDRLRGGAAERAARQALGPRDLHRIRRAALQAEADGPRTSEGLLLGTDEQGAPVRIPALRAHATIVGGSNSGKTNTAAVLLEAHVAGGGGSSSSTAREGASCPSSP